MSNSKSATLPLAGHVDLEARTIRQIVWRFMPLLMACYLTAYIDRVNVGFAALSANKDLGLSPSQYGWGAGPQPSPHFFTRDFNAVERNAK
jgi:hypothetical protein